MPALPVLLLAAGLAVGCGDGQQPTSTFCSVWLELTTSGRDAVLDERIREWASSEEDRGESARFLACMAEGTRAQSHRITEACRSNLAGVQAPAAVGQIVIEAGRICAGVDMY